MIKSDLIKSFRKLSDFPKKDRKRITFCGIVVVFSGVFFWAGYLWSLLVVIPAILYIAYNVVRIAIKAPK